MRPKSYTRVIRGTLRETSEKLAVAMQDEGFVILARSEVKPALRPADPPQRPVIVIRARYPLTVPSVWLSPSDVGRSLRLLAVIQELAEGRVQVSLMQPISMLHVAGGPSDSTVTDQLNAKLETALNRLTSPTSQTAA